MTEKYQQFKGRFWGHIVLDGALFAVTGAAAALLLFAPFLSLASPEFPAGPHSVFEFIRWFLSIPADSAVLHDGSYVSFANVAFWGVELVFLLVALCKDLLLFLFHLVRYDWYVKYSYSQKRLFWQNNRGDNHIEYLEANFASSLLLLPILHLAVACIALPLLPFEISAGVSADLTVLVAAAVLYAVGLVLGFAKKLFSKKTYLLISEA